MNYDISVMLSCWGLVQDGFTLCGSVENEILKIGPQTPNYNEMMDYFDKVHLFEHPVFEWNAITHIIHNLQDRYNLVTKPLWLPKQHDRIQKFLLAHKNCGVSIRLALPETIVEPKPIEKDKEIMITARRSLKLVKK
jgi:hypothetical protein